MTSPWSKPKPTTDFAKRLPGEPRCPNCEALLDGATSVGRHDAYPKPGDYTACMYCHAVLRVGEGLRLERMNEIEETLARAQPDMKRLLHVLGRMKKRKPPKKVT